MPRVAREKFDFREVKACIAWETTQEDYSLSVLKLEIHSGDDENWLLFFPDRWNGYDRTPRLDSFQALLLAVRDAACERNAVVRMLEAVLEQHCEEWTKLAIRMSGTRLVVSFSARMKPLPEED